MTFFDILAVLEGLVNESQRRGRMRERFSRAYRPCLPVVMLSGSCDSELALDSGSWGLRRQAKNWDAASRLNTRALASQMLAGLGRAAVLATREELRARLDKKIAP